MSDYLSEVTARSLGTAEVLQPRLASRFEPAIQGGALDPALPGQSAADERGGLAELSPEAVAPPGTREQVVVPVGASEGPSITPSPARLSMGDLESQLSLPRRANNDQSAGPETTATTGVDQPVTKPDRSESMRQAPGQIEAIRRPTQQTSSTATSVQPPDKVSSPVSHGDLPAQTAARPPSKHDERGFDERIRAAVDGALALQRTRRDDDGSTVVDRNLAQSVVGPLSSQGAHDLDERIRSAIDGASARQHSGRGAEDSASAARQSSARTEALDERSANSRTIPSHEELAPDVQPAVLTRVIAQPQVAVASPEMPVSLAKIVAVNQDAGREPQPAPTIQVTIGRIEVRATPAPTTGTTGKPRQTPAISLDEYLRQRNRGGP